MGSIQIATFNCFGVAMDLRAVLRRRGPPDAHRLSHPIVREVLEQADVVCLQEVWIPEAVELFEALTHPHKVHDGNGWTFWPLTIAGSGLGVASRLPLVERALGTFQCGGALSDRLARKGWVHARARLREAPVRELDLFTTHLQAGDGAASRRVRSCQLGELRAAIDERGAADRPALLCGDMNIDGLRGGGADEYQLLREIFPDFLDLGSPGDAPTMCPRADLNPLAHRYWSAEPNQRIDYLLYRAGAARWIEVDSAERILDEELSPVGGPATFASDHFGMAAKLRIAAS